MDIIVRSIRLSFIRFSQSANRPGFSVQLRSALSRLNNDCSFLSRFLSANAFDLTLAVLTQKIETNTVILVRFNQMIEAVFEFEKVHFVHLALEDAILHPLPEIFQCFENFSSAFIIADIVRNDKEHNLFTVEKISILTFYEEPVLLNPDKSLLPANLSLPDV